MSYIEQVKAILHSQVTPYKGIDISKIPQKILLEFLLYKKPETPQITKKQYELNLIIYGFLPSNNQTKIHPQFTHITKSNNIYIPPRINTHNSECGSCPDVV